MHHPRHAYTIRNLRAAAFLLCLKRALIASAVVTLAVALYRHDNRLTLISLGALATALLSAIVQWIFASSARCPLCMMPVLSRKGCSTHRHARQFLGSLRLRVALSILFKGYFHCPYCNEPTVLRLKPLPQKAAR